MHRNETTETPPRQNVISEEPHGKIIALSLLLAFLWGGNSPSIKVGLQDFPPMALAFFRFVIGLVIVSGWSFYRRVSFGLRRGEFSRLLLLTAIFILQIICLNTGTELTTASRSTIFINVYPFSLPSLRISGFPVNGSLFQRHWVLLSLSVVSS